MCLSACTYVQCLVLLYARKGHQEPPEHVPYGYDLSREVREPNSGILPERPVVSTLNQGASPVVLNLWVVNPLGVKRLSHRGHLRLFRKNRYSHYDS